MSDFWLGAVNLKNAKRLKKDITEELMTAVWHPKRWWDWWLPKDKKKVTDPNFTDKVRKC